MGAKRKAIRMDESQMRVRRIADRRMRSVCYLLALAALTLAAAAPASAQRSAPPAPPAQSAASAIPDRLTQLKLIWGTMAAVDQANRSGNYSVLRDLGSPAFQASNNPAALAGVFAAIREQKLDLSDTLVVEPVFEFPPAMTQPDVLRMRGAFPLRPTPIRFDLLFRWQGGWRLEGVAIAPGATPGR
jgi:hypothetical protein